MRRWPATAPSRTSRAPAHRVPRRAISWSTKKPGSARHPAEGVSRRQSVRAASKPLSTPAPSRSPEPLNGRAHLSGPRGRAHSKYRRNLASGEVRARALPARRRGRRRRARPRLAPPACARPGARRAVRETPSPSFRRPPGAASSRCCSGSSELLSDEEPKLADGTVLSAHQVDALSGTLAALLAEAQRSDATATGAPPPRPHPSCSPRPRSSGPTTLPPPAMAARGDRATPVPRRPARRVARRRMSRRGRRRR